MFFPSVPFAPFAPTATAYLGLAPFLRMSIAGMDFGPIGQQLLAMAQEHQEDANLWMNLATLMFCLEKPEVGTAMQSQALALARTYHLPALQQPARLRVLLLVAPGDLSANTPLDCLLEDSDIDLDFYYVSTGNPLAAPIPEHDVLMVGISLFDQSREALAALVPLLAQWSRPVVNAPQFVPNTERNTASRLLQGAPGLVIPLTHRLPRAQLAAIAAGETQIADLFPDCAFPIILRPVGSHAGIDLEKIDAPAQIDAYLAQVDAADFFLSRFVDYSGADGLFRKFRVALIEGEPFACHMAVSAHWMVHYVNADMYEDVARRDEEAAFMASFESFALRHRGALAAIAQRSGLDYICVDCAETAEGLLVFEIDHAMVVHAMDPEDLFPYKQAPMHQVRDAMRNFLLRRASAGPNEGPSHGFLGTMP